jgi:hypothetical protein
MVLRVAAMLMVLPPTVRLGVLQRAACAASLLLPVAMLPTLQLCPMNCAADYTDLLLLWCWLQDERVLFVFNSSTHDSCCLPLLTSGPAAAAAAAIAAVLLAG